MECSAAPDSNGGTWGSVGVCVQRTLQSLWRWEPQGYSWGVRGTSFLHPKALVMPRGAASLWVLEGHQRAARHGAEPDQQRGAGPHLVPRDVLRNAGCTKQLK